MKTTRPKNADNSQTKELVKGSERWEFIRCRIEEGKSRREIAEERLLRQCFDELASRRTWGGCNGDFRRPPSCQLKPVYHLARPVYH